MVEPTTVESTSITINAVASAEPGYYRYSAPELGLTAEVTFYDVFPCGNSDADRWVGFLFRATVTGKKPSLTLLAFEGTTQAQHYAQVACRRLIKAALRKHGFKMR